MKKSLNFVFISDFFATFVPKYGHKMRLNTHIIIRILTVILLLTGLSGGGNQAYALSGSGTSADPFKISSEADWKEIANGIYHGNYVSSYIELEKDITVTFNYYWDSIGRTSSSFQGTFDGQGHTLTIYINDNNAYPAPFASISGNATIKNLRVDGTIRTVDDGPGSGGIVGESRTGNELISNCICSVTIDSSVRSGSSASHGGIVAYSLNESSGHLTIENCLFAGKFRGSNDYGCGGFIGFGAPGYVDIKNCVFAPTEITMSGGSYSTFSRVTNTTYTNCYYITQFGDTNGRAQYSSSSSLSDKWVIDETNNPNRPYLETFASRVRVIGWVKDSYDEPRVFMKKWNNVSDYAGSVQPVFTYKSIDGGSYNSNQPPTSTSGHFAVTTVMNDNWTCSADFWVVEPPTANSLTYNRADQPLLTASTSPAEAGTFYYIFNNSSSSSSIPTAQDVGDYSVSFFVSSPGHEDIGDQWYPAGSVDVTIAPKNVSEPTIELSQTTYTYDKTAKQPAVLSVKDGSDVIPASEYSFSYSDNTNAGAAKVTVTDNENGNYIVNGTTTFTINPKTVTNPAIELSQTSYVYNAEERRPDVLSVYDGSDLISSSEYTVGYLNNVSVGTDAKVTVTDNANGNYTVNGSTTFSITKEQLVVTVTANDLYYNYEEQELVTGSVKGSGTYKPILYSLDNVTYTTDVPKGKKVKTYKVYYKIEGDDNHIGTDVSSVDASIKSKKVDNPKIEISPSVCTYDGKPKTPDVRVYDGTTEILSSEFTVSYSNNTNVGTATVTITDNEGGTYTVSGTATFTIQEEGSSYIPPTAKTGLTYTGKAQDLISVGSTSVGEMQYSLDGKTYSTDIPKGTDAKTYTVYYKVVGDANHEDSTPATVEVTISKKTVSKPTITLSASSFVYNGKAQEPTVTVKDGDSEIPASQYTVSYSNNVNVGTATVTITGKDDGNYIVNGSATFQIVDADSKVTAPTAKTGLTYNSKAQELVTAGSAEGGRLEYSTDGKSYSTSLPTGTDAKTYTVYYRVSGDDNHGDASTSSISVTISAKTVKNPTITVNPSVFTYDGTAKKPDVSLKDGDYVILSSEYTVSYSNNTKVGTATVTIKDNDGGNYTVSGTATFYIQEAGSSYIPPTAKTGLTYTGKAQELVTPGSTTTGTMHYYSLDGKSYSTDIPTGIDAKTYTVYYKVVGDDNHEDSPAVELSVTISSKDVANPTITLSQSSYFYDGTAKKPSVTVKDGDTTIDSKEYTVSYSNNTNIGSATVTIKDKEGGNYIVSGKTSFFIIDPKSGFTPPSAISGLEYNGSAQKLIEAGSAPDDCKIVYSLDGKNYSADIPTGTDAKTYTIYAKLVDKDNKDRPNTEVYTLTATINRKSVFISVTLADAGPQKIPVITVTDLDGNKLGTNAFSVIFTNAEGQNVEPDKGKIAAGTYTVTVSLTGNFTGPSVAKGILILKDYSFAFTMESDLITICLPYDREKPAGYDIYRLNSIDNTGFPVFKRLNTTTLSAGEPYLFKYTGSSTRGSRTLDLSPSDSKSIDTSTKLQTQTAGNLIFVGTFQDMSNEYATKNGSYILQTDGTWKVPEYANNKICLEAFHAYLHYRNRSVHVSPMTMTLTDSGKVDPEPEPAAIDGVILEEEDGSRAWYDLQGRRLDGPQKGVNILRTKDGKTKKVVKK